MATNAKTSGHDVSSQREATLTTLSTEQGTPTETNPDIDLNEAMRFLNCFGPNENFYFQTFADRKSGNGDQRSLARTFYGQLPQFYLQLAELNLRGAGVYFTVNETDGMGRKTVNITRVRALFVDLDGAPLDPVLTHTIRPHIAVESSPGRFHAYWLTDDCPLDQFKPAQQQLAHQFNGDPKVCDLPRVMRLPGFLHQKSTPFQSKIIFPE